MDLNHLVYAGLLAFTISVPLIRSFERRIHYAGKWKFLLPAILITAAVFLIWDAIFTARGIWGFSHDYTVGLYILKMPIEEWLFFIIIPFATVFVFEVLDYFIKNFNFPVLSLVITIVFTISFSVLFILYFDRTYTMVVTGFTVIVLLMQFVVKSYSTYLSMFYLSFIVCLIPFLLVNGILTKLPVVFYDDTENLAFRVFTIPIEDFIYFLALYLMNMNLYKYFQGRFATS
jgi:lycopene cyclase domain-containing protein